MGLPKSFTTVTSLSKILAAILFITFPFLGFFLGIQYQKGVSPQISNQVAPSPTISCKRYETICDPNSPSDIGGCRPKKVCVDPAPTQKPEIIPTTYEGMFCGGITGKPCGPGFTCQITDRYPDAGGKCVRDLPPRLDNPADPTICTQEAMTCPDGSSVGRQGPNCVFASCPR